MLLVNYFIFALIEYFGLGLSIFDKLTLNSYLVINQFQIWRLLTYSFLHDLSSPFHVLFNCLLLFFVGQRLEVFWGRQRFVVFVVLTALSGGIFVCFSYLLNFSILPVAGFSPVTLGMLIAWFIIYSNDVIYFFGVIPVKGKQMLWISLFIEVLYSISKNNISSAAHFGGIVMSIILTLGLWRPYKLKTLFYLIAFKKLK